MGDLENAEKAFRTIIESRADMGRWEFNRSLVANNYLKLLIDTERFPEARALLRDCAGLFEKLRGTPWETGFLRNLSGLEKGEGNPDKALDYAVRAMEVGDSINDQLNEVTFSELARELDMRHEKIIREKERESGQWKLWVAIISVALILITVVSAVVLRWLVRRHRKLKGETDESLSSRGAQLSNVAMHIGRQSELLNEIQREIMNPRQSKTQAYDNVRTIMRRNNVQDTAWDTFREKFEQANRGFFDKLYLIHPDLTNNEVRICAFILMDMSTKEIASMTNRTVNTINSAKYQLRRKLGIKEATEAYIRHISSASDDEVGRLRAAAAAHRAARRPGEE